MIPGERLYTATMTETFNERLERTVRVRDSHLCVGLDPDFEKVRATMRDAIIRKLSQQPLFFGFVTTEAGRAQQPTNISLDQLADEPDLANEAACEMVIAVTHEHAAAFKPNAAFFEMALAGSTSLPELMRSKPEPVLSIYDGKRGDIGNSSDQYARRILEQGGYDAVTVNPLMGRDAVAPFLRNPERGAFLLCLTSNPGADDFLTPGDLYKRIAEKAVEWNTNGNVGLVVGATRPEQAAAVRAIAPNLPFLVPGVGAQGAPLDEILDAIDARNNRRFLINSSRGIMFAKPEGDEDLFLAIANAAARLRAEINAWLAKG